MQKNQNMNVTHQKQNTDNRRPLNPDMSSMSAAVHTAEDLTDDLQKSARLVTRRTGRAARHGLNAVEHEVRQQPLVFLGLATLAGFALGALWKVPNRTEGWTDQAFRYIEPHYRAVRRHF